MRIYVAAPWAYRIEASSVAHVLERHGHTITRDWWKHPDSHEDGELSRQAIADLLGVENCELLVVCAFSMSAGKATELGYALKRGIPIIILMPKRMSTDSNIFYHHPGITETVHNEQELCIAVWDVELRRLDVTKTL